MGHKQYGKRMGGGPIPGQPAAYSYDPELYQRATAARKPKCGRTGRVHPLNFVRASEYKHPKTEDTNAHHAKNDAEFIAACGLAKVPASARQFSKWKNGRGAARDAVRAKSSQALAEEIKSKA